MRLVITEKIMNIGIFAHVDAGKTTITENLLYQAGVIRNIGRVDDGNTVTDQMALEKKRGISIQSTPISFYHGNVKINLIDTPGHVEFVAEVERAMSILDGAVLVISAKEGVQSHTILLFESLKKLGIPLIIFINKIDRSGVDRKQLIQGIRCELTQNIIELQEVSDDLIIKSMLNTSAFSEELFIYDDNLLESYLNGECVSEHDQMMLLKKLTINQEIYPICFGSALHDIGMEALLDTIVNYLPQLDYKPVGEVEGVVFKITRNNHDKREIYIRLYQGTLRSRGLIGDEKISFLKVMNQGKLEYTKEVYGNDIVVIMGPNHLKVGDVLGQPAHYQSVSLGTPTLRTRIKAENTIQLVEVLNRLSEGDPFLRYELDEHSGDVYLNLFGDIQMEILESLIFEQYRLKIHFDEPVIIYKEMPVQKGTYALYIYTKEHPFYATVGISVEPYEGDIEIVSDVSTGYLPQTFQNGIVDGIKQCLQEGLKGWALTHVKITITEGEFCSVNSTPADFRNLSPMVFMEALNISKTSLLWPINKFYIKVDRCHYGRIMSDLMTMKAYDLSVDEVKESLMITGKIPVETSLSYEKKFASVTSGMGIFHQVFYAYEKTPENIDKERKRNLINPLDRGQYLLSKLRTL